MRNRMYLFKLFSFYFLSGLLLLSCGSGGDGSSSQVPLSPGDQTLQAWVDQSVPTNVPATDLLVAKITTDATDGGSAFTSTTVVVTGTITAVDDMKVWWNTADDLASATLAGSQPGPAVGTSYDIPLTGAGEGSGFLFYTISIPDGQEGDYVVTVSSVGGATADNIPLPLSTVSKPVGFFVTLVADKASPAPLGAVGTVRFTAEANGDDAGGNYDYQFWIQEVPQDFYVLTQDYGTGNTWDWTPNTSGNFNIAVWAKNLDEANDVALAVTFFNITNDPAQTLDAWSSESRRIPLPATDIPMAKIETTGADGGAAFTSTTVSVTGTITAVDDIKVWWNTADDLASATLAGSQSNPVVGTSYDISLTGAGEGSGYLFYTISIPSGQSGEYAITVSSVTGATADNIPLPKTTLFAVDSVTLTADKASPALLGTVGTVRFTAEANGDDAGGNYDYQFWIQEDPEVDFWVLMQDYGNGNTWNWTPTVAGSFKIAVWAKNIGSAQNEALTWVAFDIVSNPVEFVDLTANKKSPVDLNKAGIITFTAEANGNDSGGDYDYKFWIKKFTDLSWTMVQDYGNGNTWDWEPTAKGIYTIRVWAKGAGIPVEYEASDTMSFTIK